MKGVVCLDQLSPVLEVGRHKNQLCLQISCGHTQAKGILPQAYCFSRVVKIISTKMLGEGPGGSQIGWLRRLTE